MTGLVSVGRDLQQGPRRYNTCGQKHCYAFHSLHRLSFSRYPLPPRYRTPHTNSPPEMLPTVPTSPSQVIFRHGPSPVQSLCRAALNLNLLCDPHFIAEASISSRSLSPSLFSPVRFLASAGMESPSPRRTL